MKNKASIFLNGIIKENPVLVLLLGTCPTLATTGSVVSAFAMGVAATAVLFCSNIVISALRKAIPDKVRIPCYIVVIAGFVTVVQMLMEAYLPDLYNMLGIYLPLLLLTASSLAVLKCLRAKTMFLIPLLTALAWVLALPLRLSLWLPSVKFWAQAHGQATKLLFLKITLYLFLLLHPADFSPSAL